MGITNGPIYETNGGRDFFFLKMDRSGNLLIEKQYGMVTGPTYGFDASNGDTLVSTTLDSNNSMYFTAYTNGNHNNTNAGSNDALFGKVDSNGNLLWVRQIGAETISAKSYLNVGTGSEIPESIVLSRDEQSFYFLGETNGAFGEANSGNDLFIGKMSSEGELVFIKHLGDVTSGALSLDNSGQEYSGNLHIDSDGNVYVIGSTTGSLVSANGGGTDIFVLKFDSNGNYLAGRQFGSGSGFDTSEAESIYPDIRVGPLNEIYITFDSRGNFAETNTGAGTTDDIVVMRLDTSLQTVWTKHYGSVTLSSAQTLLDDRPRSITVSPDGGFLIIQGYTFSDLSNTIAGSRDAFLMKIDSSNGSIIWLNHYGMEAYAEIGANGSHYEHLTRPAIGAYGNLFAGMITQSNLFEPNGDASNSTYDAAFIKFTSEGKLTK